MATATETPIDAEKIRRDFPILETIIHGDKRLVYLDNAATTQRPQAVIQAVVDAYEKHYANVHRGIHWLSEQSTNLYEEARVRVQQFLGASSPHEIIFTTGATASINLVARSWGDVNVKAGDEILLTEMEHHSNIVPWQQLAERTGATIKWIPITETMQLDLASLEHLLSSRTKLVAITAVSNVLGTINPVAEIVKRAHAYGAIVLVDAAQSAPHEATDVQQWNADFVAFSGHKMMGPSGVGILYGRESLLEAMPPFMGGGSMIRRVTLEGFEPADLPDKFEAGTPPIVPALGLRAAIDYLEQVGLSRVAAHERVLTRYAHQRMSQLDSVTLIGSDPEIKSGIVTFVMNDVHAHDVASRLDSVGVAIRAGHHCAMPLHKKLGLVATNRASFYLYNTLEEVDALVAGLAQIHEWRATHRGRRRT
ncbi:cysteine desulfurase, SufS subfamily [Pirellula staleyi DSM 6068]|uniref:Probable cysteine desulfurase n=1 Tax=Pirellula staleyi (strain ATCC 27377 / DSM 6068 / ICPB 4128) TaxID=530564 RepID=D2QWB9_PIRSD|nr:cysteine desulfurase [Pirellula staleyi]ADB15994.1 cysteine desulfurase, SufS subfamily [Pirellula staleyi DSM 6068]